MKSLSQVKVSTISFLLALLISLAVFGTAAYFAISGLSYNDEEEKTPDGETVDVGEENPDVEIITPADAESLKGESFTLLVAGYDTQMIGFDAMAVIDVNKEMNKVSIYPINVDTKVYVGHGDSNNLNLPIGELIKFKDMQYVLDKFNASTGLKVEYYVTLTAQGFIEAFDAFNKSGDYTYVVPKDMEHVYVEVADAPEAEEGTDVFETIEQDEREALEKFNISFKKGDKLTSGIDIYNMLRYKGDSDADRLTRQSAFVKDVVTKIIPKRFKEGNLEAVLDTAKALVKLKDSISTNISTEVFLTETFDLIGAIPSFSMTTVKKYTTGITNFK